MDKKSVAIRLVLILRKKLPTNAITITCPLTVTFLFFLALEKEKLESFYALAHTRHALAHTRHALASLPISSPPCHLDLTSFLHRLVPWCGRQSKRPLQGASTVPGKRQHTQLRQRCVARLQEAVRSRTSIQAGNGKKSRLLPSHLYGSNA